MVEAPTLVNHKELALFLGLINFYARFINKRADNLKALYDCANEKEFKWTDAAEKAFLWVKSELISPRVLAHFDVNEKVILACDASAYGLSAILSHQYKDGTERPIAYASKRIPEKEMSRAIIVKEASAIVFGFTRFYDFVYGREITLRTDHQPLEYIFGPKAGIPVTATSRLQRWAYFLSGFKYSIEYIRSQANANCDALSRLPIEETSNIFTADFTPVYSIQEGLKYDNRVAMRF